MKGGMIILTLLLTIQQSGLTQGFLEGDPTWHIREYHFSPVSPSYSLYSRIYKLGQDTSINGREYKEVIKSDYQDTTQFEETGMFLWESSDTVFYKHGRREGVYLINRGSVVLDFVHGEHCELMWFNYDSLETQGRTLFINEYNPGFSPGPIRLIEDVGYENRMFWESHCVVDRSEHKVRCQYRNGNLVYKLDDGEPCFLEHEIYTSTRQETELEIEVFPTKLSIGEDVYVKGIDQGEVIMWNIQGYRLGIAEIVDGAIKPEEKGTIILQVINSGITIHVTKVQVE